MGTIITLENSPEGSLSGRVLMLNTEKAKRFQCFGFVVTLNSPIQTVPQQHQELPLRKALADGVLLDITSGGGENAPTALDKKIQEIDKAVKAGNLDPVKEEEVPEMKVLIGKDAAGNSYIITPKDEADYERMQNELKETGHLRVEKPKRTQFTGLSGIYEADVDES